MGQDMALSHQILIDQGIALYWMKESNTLMYVEATEGAGGSIERRFVPGTATLAPDEWHYVMLTVPKDAKQNPTAALWVDGAHDIDFQVTVFPEDVP
eukprot:2666018-Pyramimonas_sp.AAC.1